MTSSPFPTITVLLLHHAADELTRHHYRLLRDTNREDDGVTIVPICFAEYRDQALPGSYIARNPADFRIHPWPAFHRFQPLDRSKLSNWKNLDAACTDQPFDPNCIFRETSQKPDEFVGFLDLNK